MWLSAFSQRTSLTKHPVFVQLRKFIKRLSDGSIGKGIDFMEYTINQIKEPWSKAVEKMNQSKWFKRLNEGELELCHYKGYLLETYFHTQWNPQIQAFATMYLKENYRDINRMFYRHATSEIGHDLMALSDLKELGVKEEDVIHRQPLPETIALNAFTLYQIQFVDPLCYLGYLFHLEFLPTQNGHGYKQKLMDMGVPESALTFIEEHATVDVGHNKMMESYVKTLVKSDKDLKRVIQSSIESCKLHQHMIEASFVNGEEIFK